MSALGSVCRVFGKKYKEIAEMIGVTPQTFNDWVKQKRKIPKKRIEQLEDIFKVEKGILEKQEEELTDIDRLKIKKAYLKSINKFVHDPNISIYPFWSHDIELRKLDVLIENKMLLEDIGGLIQGGGFIEDENYSIESVKNYQLFEGLVKVLRNKDKEKIQEFQKILLNI